MDIINVKFNFCYLIDLKRFKKYNSLLIIILLLECLEEFITGHNVIVSNVIVFDT